MNYVLYGCLPRPESQKVVLVLLVRPGEFAHIRRAAEL
jgi:hypothetical protein